MSHLGQPTAVINIGGASPGGAGVNFMTNNLQANSMTAWAKGSGSFLSSPAWSTATPLYGGGALLETFSAGTKTANDYFEGALTAINPASLGQSWQINFAYYMDAGATFGATDLEVGLWDVTNSLFISAGYLPVVLGAVQNASFFVFPSTSTSYTLRIRSLVGSTTCVGNLRVGNVSIAPQVAVSVPAVGGWIPYDPTSGLVGFGTPSGVSASYRRVGTVAEIEMVFISGTSTAVPAQIPLPNGYTVLPPISGNTQPLRLGRFYRGTSAGSTAKAGTVVATSGNSYVGLSFDDYTSTIAPDIARNGNDIVSTGMYVRVVFTVPIAQWSSSIQVSAEAQEFVSNSDTGNLASPGESSFNLAYNVIGTGGSTVPSITSGTGTVARYMQWSTPYKNTDKIFVEVDQGGGNWVDIEKRNGPFILGQNSYFFGIQVVPTVGSAQFVVFFGCGGYAPTSGLGAAGGGWSAMSTWKWRVRKVSGGSLAEVPPVVRCEYRNQVVTAASTALRFTDKTLGEDTHGCYDTATGVFTNKVKRGVFLVGFSVTPSAAGANTIRYTKNGSTALLLQDCSASVTVRICFTIRLELNDYFTISGNNTFTAAAGSQLSVERIGD